MGMNQEREDTFRFRHVMVDQDNPPDPHCKAAGDVDGDGYPDLLAASASGGGLFWCQYPDWKKHCIAEGPFTTDMAVPHVEDHVDVVIPNNEGLIWYQNPRSVGGDLTVDPWQAINVSPAGARMHDVEVADMDGDGQVDIVVAKMHQATPPQEVSVYGNLGRGEAWRKHVVSTRGSHNIVLVDIGRTGRMDIFGANWNNRSSTQGAIELWLNQA